MPKGAVRKDGPFYFKKGLIFCIFSPIIYVKTPVFAIFVCHPDTE